MAKGKQITFIGDKHVQRQLAELVEALEMRQSAVLRLAIDRLWLANFAQPTPRPTPAPQDDDKGGEQSPPIGE